VRVAAAILIGGRFVLVRHRGRDGAAYHLLPGGGVELGETLAETLEREVREETGLECTVGAPLIVNDTIFPDRSRHIVNLTFACSMTGGDITSSPADPVVEAVDLVDPYSLECFDLRPPIGAALLEAFEAGFSGPARYLGSVWTTGRDGPEALREGGP